MGLPALDERTERLATGITRGVMAAMTMTGLRQITTGLGLVDQTPPDAVLKQRGFGVLVQSPRLAYFLARRQVAVVELAHWAYGAGAGAAFALLPPSLLRRRWTGVGYGLATWVAFEVSVAPVLGLDQAKQIRPIERLMFALDHVLFGVVLAGDGRWALPERGRLLRRPWRRIAGR